MEIERCAYLLGELYKVLCAPICPRPRREHRAKCERKQGDLEQRPPGIVLVRHADVPQQDRRPGDPVMMQGEYESSDGVQETCSECGERTS